MPGPAHPNTAILVAAPGSVGGPWAAAVGTALPGRPVHVWPDLADKATIGYALAWNPPRGLLRSLPNLRAVFSLGAGVDHLVLRDDQPEAPIVRVVNDDLTRRMSEWVALQVLIHHRRLRAYDAQRRARQWRELPQPAAGAVRVGIMGMGVLGGDAAGVLVRLGFDVAGWTRRPRPAGGVRAFHWSGELDAFLARTDILVALLPLTPETRGILAMPLFRKLARDGALGGPVLINAGRGGLQVERDIVAALDEGVLIGASLDVFESEPLAAASPLWGYDSVTITPHNAAWSSPEAIVPAIVRQIVAFEAGAPLGNVIDRAALY